MIDEALDKYLQQMSVVKMRQSVISNILKKRNSTGYVYSDIEISVLEIRKIIELIAMGSLVSNIEDFSKIHDKYATYWNARLMFKDIERINKDFFPEPISIKKSKKVDEFVKLKSGYLNKEEAISLYLKCGEFLHEDNPYRKPHDIEYYRNNLPIWNSKIINLLNRHLIHLCNGNFYFVVMQSLENGKPSGNIFEPFSK